MKVETIHLGYSIPAGEGVAIPLRHTVVTGQSQEAGKTTALEALIHRSGLRAITFITKRGEGAFAEGARVEAYFRERADWQFVSAVLEAQMRERMKFERAWIMKASKGAKTLADVQRNVREFAKTAKGLNADMYLQLDAYLDIVVPEISAHVFAPRVDLRAGINVMDLTAFRSEMQALIIRSVLEWVFEREENVITIIPEAWEFIPQQRNSPVKIAAVQLIRKGAGLKNYVWLDSQDIAGVDKELLRQMPVWLLGVQRERNEVKRTLDQIPDSIAKPKAADLMTLNVGEFFACYGTHAIKTYVQPRWINEAGARGIAQGIGSIHDHVAPTRKVEMSENGKVSREVIQKLDLVLHRIDRVEARVSAIENRPAAASGSAAAFAVGLAQPSAPNLSFQPSPNGSEYDMADFEEFYQKTVARLRQEAPELIQVLAISPEIEVTFERKTFEYDAGSPKGALMRLIAEGWLDEPGSPNKLYVELRRLGVSVAKPTVYGWCKEFSKSGLLTVEGDGYKIAPNVKKSIKEK